MKYHELELSLISPDGKRERVCFQLGQDIMTEGLDYISPPCDFTDTFESVIKIMKKKEYRKDLFMNACREMGKYLSEKMEDKEGWHGVSRQEQFTHKGNQDAELT